MDLLLDSDGDLYIGKNGDVRIEQSVAQEIKIRLKWFEGEWKWNRDRGIPYLTGIFGRKPNINYIEQVIREKIFEVTVVTNVRNVSVIFDKNRRTVRIDFTAETDTETIREEVDIVCQIMV